MPLKDICFVVMPFGTKDTGLDGPNQPNKVNFDELWNKAIKPAIESLGYRAVRADEDRGALIIVEMIERLMYSDLVVADISLANANVYYEVGLRHAARSHGCVLIGADWAKPVFDLNQIRRIPYANPTERVDDASAEQIVATLMAGIPAAARSPTPHFEIGSRYVDAAQQQRRAHELAQELDAFEATYQRMQSILERPPSERPDAARALMAEYPAEEIRSAYFAATILPFVRDATANWQTCIDYIDRLPAELREQPFVREQRALAASKNGDHHAAIEALKTLIALSGATPERCGLLGGRYKKLYRESVKKGSPWTPYLDAAIEHYEQGMMLELNDYYCSCNLPALYRERGGADDESRAVAAATAARFACERARARGSADVWLRPTLLGLAFSEGNSSAAEQLSQEVARSNGVGWQLETTLDDLKAHVAHHSKRSPEVGAALQPSFERVLEAWNRLKAAEEKRT